MSFLSTTFFKLNGREQTLLVLSLWTIILVFFVKLIGSGIETFREWSSVSQLIDGHDAVLGQEVEINREIDLKKKEQRGVTYDERLLQKEVSRIWTRLFQSYHPGGKPAGGVKTRKSTETQMFFQHNMEVTLSGVKWSDLTMFVKEFFLDDREKYIFFSKVDITPKYNKNPEVYNATFYVSSVEFRN